MFMLKSVPLGAPRLARSLQTFGVLDSQINVLRNGKTIIAQGTGGRASRTGYTVTVFGAPGTLGTALVTKLAKHGTITVCPYRDEYFKRHLKPTGDLGVVNFKEFDLRNVASIETAVKHSDVVVNCIGRDYETKHFKFHDVNVEGTRRIAEAVAKYAVPRFIHVSSHSATHDSPSAFLRTKAAGEEVVREIIPDSTIVRPAPIYGYNGYNWLQKMAGSRLTFTASGGQEISYPTHVNDVASALEKMVYDDSTTGKIYELNGPESWSKKEIFDRIKSEIKRDFQFVNIPKPLLRAWATFLQYAAYWQGPLSPDEVERMFISQAGGELSEGAYGYSDLGIFPGKLSENITHLVRHHRNPVYIADSTETDKLRRKERDAWANIVD